MGREERLQKVRKGEFLLFTLRLLSLVFLLRPHSVVVRSRNTFLLLFIYSLMNFDKQVR